MDPQNGVPEGYCKTCECFTTQYNSRGECRECGTEVTEGVTEEIS